MKLSPRDAEGYFKKPDPDKTGLLIYGADAMRVALKRQQMLAALLGAAAEEEMRLTRMPGSELRKDPAQLLDAVKAVGFFPGPRAVFVEEANDSAAPAILAALEDWQPGDAQIVVTAGQLKATSKLRKGFESHRNAYATGIYDDPPSRAEIERILSEAQIRDVPSDSMSALTDIANDIGPGDFSRMIEKLALYKYQDSSPLSLEDIDAVAPQSTEAALDDVLNVVAEGRSAEIGPLLRRLQAQGTNAVTLCIGATRHFRTLYTVAADPGGPAQGIGRLRPPLYGKRRDRMLRQAQGWGAAKLQTALTILTDTDLQLRSAGQTAPALALMERALIRLAMLSRARQ
ncbi:DNA polymerase III subunit delta [Phaeobacter gallaeciensis]|uniref:DNA-directed DNA polymerase n=1 Tax=Phaeobacter gallaeciensis TaxID=60890 RepID=A0A1B0ZS46_9RHOB|nr:MULTISPECIES: DNA polymerase III subunit delta [Phaeobacter]ANP36981.1 DNA polymerase III subunit delta [Phaeobacter gallaeciensis]MDE4060904.1 DNA polymerase III subunit delta [Phaeobacter gallaeciensis]MDE4123923.1 DNA polymerase III subunit delta [Phaeobacter gallaeciensis]MDE4128393.1 DNA polymerase III subunit delta [Phaeobacter gallaeciensis]PVZ46335.1 DNA polymerase III subunit delta [Phaeobacter sp. JL2872]